MFRRRPIFLFALAAPLTVLQLDLSSCLQLRGPTDGGSSINFNVPPVPVISADAVRGVAPLAVQFSSSASTDDGLIVQRIWNFGDGQTSRDISPSHTFTTTGNFTVRLTLVDDQGAQATRSIVIAVTQAPVASIVTDRTAAESAPAIFNFDGSRSFDPDGTIVSYQWDFGDGSRELLPVVVHTYAAPGTFRARLTVTDNNGVTGTADVIIEVGIPRPRIEFRAPPSDVTNLVVSNSSSLWLHTVFSVQPGVPRMLRAGLDGDTDICNAQSVLFDAATGTTLGVISGHADRVRSAVFDPLGFIIVTGSDDRTVRINDAGSGLLLQTFGGNVDAVTSVAVSPDSNLIAYGVEDGTVAVRNRNTGALLNNFLGHTSAVSAVAFSPDGTQVLSGSDDRTARLWSLSSGALVRTFSGHAFGVTSVAFSPVDGTLILTGSVDQTARLWDATNGAVLARFEPRFDAGGGLIGGHSNSVSSVAFSPDGALVLTGSDDATARIWPLTGGNELRTLSGHTDRVSAVAFSPDGARIATGSVDGTARLWTTATGAFERSVKPCNSTISSVAFSPDGTTLLTGVAARNDIQLDTNPPSGNDLNLTVPTALNLASVAAGQYALWVEVNTDRTTPSRTYATASVNVVAPYTSGIDNFTPRIPLVDDAASVLVNSTANRQIFDLGPLRAGDRIFLNLLTLPGYAKRFRDDRFSVLLLDAEQKMLAWYQDGAVLFSADTKLVVGHDSASYFVVIDSGDSVSFSIARGAGLLGDGTIAKRQQRVFLDFDGVANLTVGTVGPVDLPAFNAAALNPNFGDAETAIIKTAIKAQIEAIYGAFDVVVTTSDEGAPPEPPYQTVYFGDVLADLNSRFAYGVADYIDPRNETLTGSALVEVREVADDFTNLTAQQLGVAIGNAAAHLVGNLFGLRNTIGGPTDIMDPDLALQNPAVSLQVSGLDGAEQYGPSAIGIQDALQLLEETVGLAP